MKTNIKESKETPNPNRAINLRRSLSKERKNIRDEALAKC
jgi:hypothetical protein